MDFFWKTLDTFYQARNDEKGYEIYILWFWEHCYLNKASENKLALKLVNTEELTGIVSASLNSLAITTNTWTTNDSKCGDGRVGIYMSHNLPR